jgi:predicted secreted protein
MGSTRRFAALLLAVGALAPVAGRSQQTPARAYSRASRPHLHASAASVWHPTDAVLKAIRSECGQRDKSQYGQCFLRGMQEKGASASAVGFAQALQSSKEGMGYETEFTEGGHVAVAQVVFPGREGSREAWLLANGDPSPIDVDNLALLPMADVRSNIVFQEIRRTYTRASVFGDSRSEASPPLVPRAAEAQEFLVNYALRDGCPDCKRVGSAQFAFDFEGNGKFEGVSLRGVWMTPDQGTLAPVSMLKDFHFHLVADHAAGYHWELASPIDERFVSLVGTTYSAADRKTGAPGVEDWTFHPRAPGRTIIRFQKVRQGEKIAPRERRFFFVVSIQ